jgi:hypothetical protein
MVEVNVLFPFHQRHGMPIRPLILMASLLLPLSDACSQGTDELRTAMQKGLRLNADSVALDERLYVDTLFSHGDIYTRAADSTLRARTDSLLKAAGDSLDASERISVRKLTIDMEGSLGVAGVPARTTVRLLLTIFEKELNILLGSKSVCEGCATRADFESELDLFRGEADSLSGFLGDSMATAVEEWETELEERVSALSDSLSEMVRSLAADHAGYLRDHESRLDIEAAYESHSNYRGRDNGVSESSFGPSLTYHHNSGIYAEGSVGWVSQPTPGPDDESLTGGYEFTLSSVLNGSLSYTHYWYSPGSTKPQAVTNQSAAGMMMLDLELVNLTLNLSDDFGGGPGSEITTSLDLSSDLPLSDHAFGGTLKISPTAGATWGDQNEKLLQRRIVRAKKKAVVRVSGKPLDVFGIMSYELSLPAELKAGDLSIEPTVGCVLPVNVLNGKTVLVKDPSTSDPFFTAGVTVTMTLR